jgi:L-threonylcarbamoyladenylate synthase
MYASITSNVKEAIDIINTGRVVVFPTGTSYGLAVDALQGHALQRLRNLKLRPQEKTFTIFMKPALWQKYLNLTAEETDFLEKYTNQAITLLVEPRQPLMHLAQQGHIGLRVIDHPIMQALAEASDVPLTATSANVSGQPACYDMKCLEVTFPGKLTPELLKPHEDRQLRGSANTTYDLSFGCILDGGTLPESKPSTIVKLAGATITVVRPGRVQL